MKSFADLYAELDSTTKTNEKVDALKRYFISADPARHLRGPSTFFDRTQTEAPH